MKTAYLNRSRLFESIVILAFLTTACGKSALESQVNPASGNLVQSQNATNTGSAPGVGSGNFSIAGPSIGSGNSSIAGPNLSKTVQIKIVKTGGEPGPDDFNLAWIDLGNAGNFEVVATADLEANGTPDVLFRNMSTGEIGYWSIANSAIASWVSLGSPALNYRIAGVADFNGDGTPDILFQDDSTGDVGYWQMNPATIASPILPPNTVRYTWVDLGNAADFEVVAIADIDGNGTPDVLFRNMSTGEIGYWSIEGGTIASWVSFGSPSLSYRIAGVADFNGDGTPDILFQDDSTGDVGYWQMNPATIAAPILPPNTARYTWVDLGDAVGFEVTGIGALDPTGTNDILLRNMSSGEVQYWSIENGAIASWASFGSPSLSYRIAAIADFNGGGTPDILFQNDSNGDVGFWQISYP